MLMLQTDVAFEEVLPPTQSGRRRGLTWGLVADRHGAAGGVLVVAQQGDGEPRRYLVTEHVPCGFDGRLFECRRVGAGRGYTVGIARNGQDDCCDCEAGTYRRVGACVHVLALRAVVQNRWYPDPLDRPADAEPTAAEIEAMAAAFGG